jgi:hypothetical protein
VCPPCGGAGAVTDPQRGSRGRHPLARRAHADRVAHPDAVDHQGFWLGGVLLALDDIGAVPWPSATREPER